MPIFCSCIHCKIEVSTAQISKHYKSKLCLAGGKQGCMPTTTKSLICSHCSKEHKNLLSASSHARKCPMNLNRVYTNGMTGKTAWNKGKRSKIESKNPEYVGKIGGYRANAGVSKKFKYLDSSGKEVCLQSSYELELAQALDAQNIKWIRPSCLKYGGKRYFPDFYLIDFDIYLDPKNDYLATLDKPKIDQVIKENKVDVRIVLQSDIEKCKTSIKDWLYPHS